MSGQFEATFCNATRSTTIWLSTWAFLHLARPGPTNEQSMQVEMLDGEKEKTGGHMRSRSGNVGEVGMLSKVGGRSSKSSSHLLTRFKAALLTRRCHHTYIPLTALGQAPIEKMSLRSTV